MLLVLDRDRSGDVRLYLLYPTVAGQHLYNERL